MACLSIQTQLSGYGQSSAMSGSSPIETESLSFAIAEFEFATWIETPSEQSILKMFEAIASLVGTIAFTEVPMIL